MAFFVSNSFYKIVKLYKYELKCLIKALKIFKIFSHNYYLLFNYTLLEND